MNLSSALILLIVSVYKGYFLGTEMCAYQQYMELGKLGTINCDFEDNFASVFWYNTTDYSNNDPIVHVRNLKKTGPGYTSGEFDVHPNGSLIIKHVLLRHERNFTIAYLHSEDEDPVFVNVEVLIIVKPSTPFSVFNYCDNASNICYTEVSTLPVQCQVANVRPVLSLQLIVRTLDGDKLVPNDISLIPEGVGYTSNVTTTHMFHYSPLLVLLVCKAPGPPLMLKNMESLILAQNGNVDLSFEEKQFRYIERNTKMHLPCTDDDFGLIVWKKTNVRETTYTDVLIYSIKANNTLTEIFADDVMLTNNGSLTIPMVDVTHGGLYYCIYGNGLIDGVISYEVSVYVLPMPCYPVIYGCDHQQYCVLIAEHDGILTCSIKGIHPQVGLEWKTFYESDTHSISFRDQQLTVKNNGETFDVILTSSYRVENALRDRLTIECKVAESDMNIFYLTTKFDLKFLKGFVDPEHDPYSQKTLKKTFWVLLAMVILILALLILCTVIIKTCLGLGRHRKDHSQTNALNKEEVTLMVEPEDALKKNRKEFIKQIKEMYKDLYEAIQPIPYIKDKLYCVDKVFAEGGIEFLDSAEGVGRSGKWKNLETYQNMFIEPLLKSKRLILEGEPGYGKSIVSLQCAYDWCNSSHASALKDVEVLILLRLRQLGGVQSIYSVIKRFLLPKDTTIGEDDIENILKSCTSVVMIFDGFDEYPDQDRTPITDVMKIIARKMFLNFKVIITTRSSILPKKYPPSTNRIRLTGFDDNSRRCYIRKAVVGENEQRVGEIEQQLKFNPILNDLCQVPLLFVIFAHMSHENDTFRNSTSVTSFFRHMISCFNSQMKNKRDDELFEMDHGELDKVAFEALNGNAKKTVWGKEELISQIGQELYDQYLRIGILVEEEVLDIIDNPGTPISEHVQYRMKVRFYHKLFCEWYAARYLSDYLQQNLNVDLSDFLQHLHPFDVQYMYRFSCGLNVDSAGKIISYLKNIEGGDKFAILCILEQTGKIDDIKETIRQLCDEGVIISSHDSLLLQRSSMQLLELAARNDIPIEMLRLINCLHSVELSTAAIRTTSGLALSSWIPVKTLQVSLSNRDMTEDEAIAILKFSSMCPSLRQLWYGGCVPPRIFQDKSTLSTLKSRNVTVCWIRTKHEPRYILNLQTGRWENKNDGSEPTVEDFERMMSEDAEDREGSTEEEYKAWVKKCREDLRRRAEKRRSDAQ